MDGVTTLLDGLSRVVGTNGRSLFSLPPAPIKGSLAPGDVETTKTTNPTPPSTGNMDYTAYADVSDPNPGHPARSRGPFKAKVLAEFCSPYCSIGQQQPYGPCLLDVTIKHDGSRLVMINKARPIIDLQGAYEKGVPIGLPQISIQDLSHPGQEPAFSLQLDLFFAEHLFRRIDISQYGFDPLQAVYIDPKEGFKFTYTLNQPLEYVHSRALCGMMSLRSHYKLEVGPPGKPKYEERQYPYEAAHFETVPIELEATTRGRFELVD